MYVLAFAALGILLLVGVGAVFAFGGGGTSSASGALIQTGSCTEEQFKGLPPAHLQNPDAPVKYNSFPPSSGPHYAQPAPWGVYPDSIKQTILVHNLEHGGIVIQYGKDVPQATVAELRDEYQSDPNGLVLAPLPALGNKIAFTAWTHLAECRTFDQDAFETFRDAFRAKGPEARRVSDLAPGSAN